MVLRRRALRPTRTRNVSFCYIVAGGKRPCVFVRILKSVMNFINCLLDYKIVFENDKSCQPAREAILVRHLEKINCLCCYM